MFEYFMPLLVMRAYPRHAARRDLPRRRRAADAVRRAARRAVGHLRVGLQRAGSRRNYQYRAFGVPGLGLKRGLADDLVIAPYATHAGRAARAARRARAISSGWRAKALAGRVRLLRSDRLHARRLPEDARRGVVLPTYMAHHQGMSLVALDNALNGAPMQHRFHADPRVQAADLLLQERIPSLVPLKNPPIEMADHVPSARATPAVGAALYDAAHAEPAHAPAVERLVHRDGHQRRRRLQPAPAAGADALARGHHDRRLGQLLLRPRPRQRRRLVDGATSRRRASRTNTRSPSRPTAPSSAASTASIETRTEVVVSPEDDAELRRVSVTNHSHRVPQPRPRPATREVVLAPGGRRPRRIRRSAICSSRPTASRNATR